MLQDTRSALCLMGGLVTALQDNDTEAFKQWLSEGTYELGEPAGTELVLDWLDPFITRVERDRIVAWHLGVRLSLEWGIGSPRSISEMGEVVSGRHGDEYWSSQTNWN